MKWMEICRRTYFIFLASQTVIQKGSGFVSRIKIDFYGTRNCITVFIRTRHETLSQIR
jgi:hypothetical protein